MNRIQLKKQVNKVLSWENLHDILAELRKYREEDLINPLFLALCSVSETVRWHAVSAFGEVVSRLADRDLEAARVVMRRFLWSLNDESGGIGWGAPEAMAEIMANHARLADEYLHMLISYTQEDGEEPFQDGNFIELPMLQRGLLWGIGRLAEVIPQQLVQAGIEKELAKYLRSHDMTVAGMALWCLAQLNCQIPMQKITNLDLLETHLPVYMDGVVQLVLVADLVKERQEYERNKIQ